MEQISATRGLPRREQGSALVELALILPLIVLLFVGAVDLGRAFYYSNAVARAAESGALYGSQNPTDTAGMVQISDQAMQAAFNSAADMSGTNATATYGCECMSGSGLSSGCTNTPSCTTNEVYYVTVTANSTYQTLLPWPGIPSSYNLSSTVTMRSGG